MEFGSCLKRNIIRVPYANRDHICVVTNIKLTFEIHLLNRIASQDAMVSTDFLGL